ncbi:hypothetical protein [Rhodoferax sp. GW822-FHT02A01]|uniref:hypothetical protein n=1 Tax=Rhodoferax sp. GW822-FHT02A01 TaxID=3141537 RepID=UPI00315D0E3D
MKKTAILVGVALLSMSAFAELPVSTGTPSLIFKAIQIENTKDKQQEVVTPYRLYDKLVVTVFDPVVCGQQPQAAKFKFTDNHLTVGYDLTPGPGGDSKNCALVSEFVIVNAPHGDFEVNFAGGDEPMTIAKLRKCPFYQPKGEDIYECLAPTK